MNRRIFLKAGLASAGLLVVGAGGWVASGPATEGPRSIEELLLLLDSWQGKTVQSLGAWNIAQVLEHCAQSVEFSLQGFPEHKSDAFKHTAGRLAFALFAAKGSMKHGLAEAIPGAPELDAQGQWSSAVLRLKKSLIDFDGFTGDLKEHFAYGALTKEQYALAHVMHFNNHMELITVS